MRRSLTILLSLLVMAGCRPAAPVAHDPGKVVLPAKKVSVAGHLYLTKNRTLYRFSGTQVTTLLKGTAAMDPALSSDGTRLAYTQLQGQSSVILLADQDGSNGHAITPSSAPEGALWAFDPSLAADGQHVVYLTDRGKPPSSPQNLQPNDLGVWTYDAGTGRSIRRVEPVDYTGGDADVSYRPGSSDQLLFTTYLYGGQPVLPVARLTWTSLTTRARIYLSPDGARNFQPAVSPDGHWLAFIHATGTSDDLYVMPLQPSYFREPQPYPTDGATLLQAGMVSQPVWAADGSAIAFMMLVNGSFDLFVLPLTTAGDAPHAAGPAQQVTHGSFLDADSRMAWGP